MSDSDVRKPIPAVQGDLTATTRQTPSILYHYTTGNALLEIVKQKKLWASDIRYLNDGEEFNYALEIFAHVLRRDFLHQPVPDGWQGETIKAFLGVLEDRAFSGLTTFVASLSAAPDELSQWRAYCRPGPGFSIGFGMDVLCDALAAQGATVVPCVYRRDEQERIAHEVFSAAFMKPWAMDETRDPWTGEKRITGPLVQATLDIAPRFKHPTFEAEQEWRIVLGPTKRTTPSVPRNYRSRNAFLVPYVSLNLVTDQSDKPFGALIVGPTPERELAVESARRFMLEHTGVGMSQVNLSATPYRDWV